MLRTMVFFSMLIVGTVAFGLPDGEEDTPGAGFLDIVVSDQEGRPVPGARVELFHDSSEQTLVETADPRGHAVFDRVSTGRWFVQVRCERCFGASGVYLAVESGRRTEFRFEVRLRDLIPGPRNLVPCRTISTSPPYWIEVMRRVLENLRVLPPHSTKPEPVLVARMIVLPDYGGPEWAVSVYRHGVMSAFVVAAEASDHIVSANLEQTTEDGHAALVATREAAYQPVEEHEVELDLVISKKVQDLFLLATKRVVPADEDRVVLHGTQYEFLTYEQRVGLHCGAVVSPESGAATHWLVQVAEALRDYAKAESEDRAAATDELTTVLEGAYEEWDGD